MKIKSVHISKLFENFDYTISLDNQESVLIVTGPNGYGKTMILNIIFNLFNRKFQFFQTLVFESILITMDNNIVIEIKKVSEDDSKQKVTFTFYDHGKRIESFDSLSEKYARDIAATIERYLPVHRTDVDSWLDRTGETLSLDDLIAKYSDQLPEKISKNLFKISEKANEILNSIQVHLIREQRLFKRAPRGSNYSQEREQTIMTETIQTYAGELKQSISDFSQKSFVRTQELDSSYPLRLRTETDILTEEEYEKRYESLKVKQKKLKDFGLYESRQEFLTYSKDDAKALSVYIKDFELKLSVFDDLLEKLELFTSILNERRFTFKTINISRSKGFYFSTNKGKPLELTQLSSGEQHEVVLLYELIFNVKPNILVLIDEPEISLHITWQKEFLNDLLKIIKIQNTQVLIATHSPSIINDRWDLVYNLESSHTK